MKLQLSDNDFDDWLITMGLLHGSQTCEHCSNQMTSDGRNRTWVCHKRRCLHGNTKPTKGLYAGTFFEESKLPRKTIFLVSFFWTQEYDTFKKDTFEIKKNLFGKIALSFVAANA